MKLSTFLVLLPSRYPSTSNCRPPCLCRSSCATPHSTPLHLKSSSQPPHLIASSPPFDLLSFHSSLHLVSLTVTRVASQSRRISVCLSLVHCASWHLAPSTRRAHCAQPPGIIINQLSAISYRHGDGEVEQWPWAWPWGQWSCCSRPGASVSAPTSASRPSLGPPRPSGPPGLECKREPQRPQQYQR